MALPPYRHRALSSPDEIRIILLQPSLDFSAPLRCDIVHLDRLTLHTFDDAAFNHYTAMSYTWGPPEFTEDLVCDGTSVYKITKNVDKMLRRLRKEHGVRNFWIDAICLNQADNDEKAVQMLLMDEVYRRALDVIIWLGDESSEMTLKAFAAFRSLALVDGANEPRSPGVALQTILGICDPKSLSAVNTLLCLPWFGRRWIIQEAALARVTTVQCGEEKLPWQWFVAGIKVFQTAVGIVDHDESGIEIDDDKFDDEFDDEFDGEFDDEFDDESDESAVKGDLAGAGDVPVDPELLQLDQGALAALRTIAAVTLQDRDIMTLIRRVEHAQCFSPHDRLFALFAMATDIHDNRTTAPRTADRENIIRVAVDYKEPWHESFTRFAAACAATRGLHDLVPRPEMLEKDERRQVHSRHIQLVEHLDRYGSLSEANPSWPSWVPDWRNTVEVSSRPGAFFDVHRDTDINQSLRGSLMTCDQGLGLLISLHQPGKVIRVLDGYTSSWSWADIRSWLYRALSSAAEQVNPDEHGFSPGDVEFGRSSDPVKDLRWVQFKTLFSQAISRISPAFDRRATEEAEGLDARTRKLMDTPDPEDNSFHNPNARVWIDFILRHQSLVLVSTRSSPWVGWGFGPQDIKLGDLVPSTDLAVTFILREVGTMPPREIDYEPKGRGTVPGLGTAEDLFTGGDSSEPLTIVRRIGAGMSFVDYKLAGPEGRKTYFLR